MPKIQRDKGPSNDIASAVGYWNDFGKVLGYVPSAPGLDQLKQFESGIHTRLNDWTNARTETISPPSEAEKLFLTSPIANTLWQALDKTRYTSGISHVAGGIADSFGLMMTIAGNNYAADRNRKLSKWATYTTTTSTGAAPPPNTPGPPVVLPPPGPSRAVYAPSPVHLSWWKRLEYWVFDTLGIHHPDGM